MMCVIATFRRQVPSVGEEVKADATRCVGRVVEFLGANSNFDFVRQDEMPSHPRDAVRGALLSASAGDSTDRRLR
jgi:hypothetical protein